MRVKLGVYLSETGNAERAIHLLEGLAGDDIEALNALGIAYGTANRAADAITTFEHVLEVDPTNGLGWQNIGTVQLRVGDRAAAEKPRCDVRSPSTTRCRRLHHARRRAVADGPPVRRRRRPGSAQWPSIPASSTRSTT